MLCCGLCRSRWAKGHGVFHLIAIDKLDKIGREGVDKELWRVGYPKRPSLRSGNSFSSRPGGARSPRGSWVRRLEAINEFREMLDGAAEMGGVDRLVVDPTLARGLGYYTGPVFEAEVTG